MSDEEDNKEKKIDIDEDEIIAKIAPASTKIFARSIVDGLRDELLKKEEEIIGRLEKWLVSTLIRRLIHSFIMDLDKIVQSAIEEKADEAEARVKRLIQEELRRLEDRIRREGLKEHMERPTISPVAQSYKASAQKQGKRNVEKELVECRTKVADLNDRLGKLFNLLIKFEPRIQTLPIIEQFGEISIDDLARMINVDKNYLMEFLNATTQAGLTIIRGGKIKVLKPIFKRG